MSTSARRTTPTSRTSIGPGHAGYTYDVKYGIHDYRGGGRASARETAARVAAGAIARKIVPGLSRARRAGADGPAQGRSFALGLERDRQQPVLLPGRQAGEIVRGLSRWRAQGGFVGRRGDRGRGRRRAGRSWARRSMPSSTAISPPRSWASTRSRASRSATALPPPP